MYIPTKIRNLWVFFLTAEKSNMYVLWRTSFISDVANRINDDVDNDIANSEEINSLIKKSGPGPIVPIVLVSVIAVLSIILAGVYIVYKKRPSLPRLKIPFNTPKFSMKTLEEAHEVENETSHIVTQSGGDDNIDGRGGGDRYLGAKAYDPVVP